MHYVLGYDPASRLMIMTQKSFLLRSAAQDYADACARGFRAFVVGTKSPPVGKWKDGELRYCATLVERGSDPPRVPADAVDSYLATQHASARRENSDAAECITLLQMIRAQPDETVRAETWRAFWDRVNRD